MINIWMSFLIESVLFLACYSDSSESREYVVKMPEFDITEMTEVSFGYFFPCDDTDKGCSITAFEAKPSEHVHHMILLGYSNALPSDAKQEPKLLGESRPEGRSDFVFAWAMTKGNDEKFTWELPQGHAYQFGPGKNDLKYLALDVHFHGKQKATDSKTEIILSKTERSDDLQVHCDILATAVNISGGEKDTTACFKSKIENDGTFKVIAQRVHAHAHGRKIETNVYRENKNGESKLVRKISHDSQRPQMFYNLEDPVIVQKDDVLETICHYNTVGVKGEITTGLDMESGEMCNHYLQFSPLNDQEDPTTLQLTPFAESCFTDLSQFKSWGDSSTDVIYI
jgi:hypothetical protein